MLDTLAPSDRALFESRILTSSWYPYRTFTSLLEAIDRETPTANGEGNHRGPSRMFRVGEFSGSQDAGTIFKIVMTLSSVERVISACPRFWKRYCTEGAFEVLEVEKDRLRVALVDFPDIDPRHCELSAGWMKGLGEAAGARNAALEKTHCVHRGDARCEYVGTWS